MTRWFTHRVGITQTHCRLVEEYKIALKHVVPFESESLTSTIAARYTQTHRQESHNITDDALRVFIAVSTCILYQMMGVHYISATILDRVIWVVQRSGKNWCMWPNQAMKTNVLRTWLSLVNNAKEGKNEKWKTRSKKKEWKSD